nr:Mediator of RNA polymerase II transcription [Hymenolepis microstoma]
MTSKDQSVPSLEERLQKLNEIDSKVMQIMESSGGTLDELSKDVPNQKQIEIHTRNFRTAIRDVELELITQLNYLSQVLTGLPFEKNVYRETMEVSLASECTTPNNLLAEDLSCDAAPPSETAESYPVVSSTVNDLELYFTETSRETTELADSTLFNHLWGVVPTKTTYSSHTTVDDTPDVSAHEFEIPEYEFDDEILSLQGDIDPLSLWDIYADEDFRVGRITPDGLIDEDFEQEIGWLNKARLPQAINCQCY